MVYGPFKLEMPGIEYRVFGMQTNLNYASTDGKESKELAIIVARGPPNWYFPWQL